MKVTTKRIILFSVLAALLLLALAVFFTIKQLQKPSREEPHVQTGSIDFYLDFLPAGSSRAVCRCGCLKDTRRASRAT